MHTVIPILKQIIVERQKIDPEFNQRKLAELSKVPQAAISRFDRQERFDINNLFSIASALDLKIDDLFKVKDTND
jgi:transcriptional regulator with XRE-family HTH domain